MSTWVKQFLRSDLGYGSRFLLKMGFESLFKSQRKLFLKYDFTDLLEYLNNQSNTDWPFIRGNIDHYKFMDIARFGDKYNLSKIGCHLRYSEFENVFLFNFKYYYVNFKINLLNRNLDWIIPFLKNDGSTSIYPLHFKNKVEKRKEAL